MDVQQWEQRLCRPGSQGGCNAHPIADWDSWAAAEEQQLLQCDSVPSPPHPTPAPPHRASLIQVARKLLNRDVLMQGEAVSEGISFVPASEYLDKVDTDALAPWVLQPVSLHHLLVRGNAPTYQFQ